MNQHFPRSLMHLAACIALAAPALPMMAATVAVDVRLEQPMSFGGLITQPSGGAITLTEDGSMVSAGSGVSIGNPHFSEGRFKLIGPPGAPFSIRIDPSLPTLAGPSGSRLQVAELRSSLPGMKGTFDASGQAELKLGGRLDIPTNPVAGRYSSPRLNLQILVAGQDLVNFPFVISAVVRSPLYLSRMDDLEFGSLIPGYRTGMFTVQADGGHETADNAGPHLFKGSPHPAQFQLTGPAGTSYSIQLPASVQLAGPGGTLQISRFTCSVPRSGNLPAVGLKFGVGASLLVPSDQTAGDYYGMFVVTVNYQ